MRLNDLGKKHLREQLERFGSAKVIEMLEDDRCWQSWVADAELSMLAAGIDNTCTVYVSKRHSASGNGADIRLFDEHFDFGALRRYSDASWIRNATRAERYESDEIADRDNGVGAFKAEVDGQMVTVYVHP